jgi:hypothetical protein
MANSVAIGALDIGHQSFPSRRSIGRWIMDSRFDNTNGEIITSKEVLRFMDQ